MFRIRFFVWLLLSVSLASSGCRYQLPALKPPKINARSAGQGAIEQYDLNQDGFVAGAELDSAPSLKFAQGRIDTNDDARISSDEIARLIQEQWLDVGAGAMRVKCVVTYKRRELEGATVTFEPESFLGQAVHPATGVTSRGFAAMAMAEEHQQHPNARGVDPGLYLVRISQIVDGKEKIPAKYNSETILGIEVAPRASYMPGAAEFHLK